MPLNLLDDRLSMLNNFCSGVLSSTLDRLGQIRLGPNLHGRLGRIGLHLPGNRLQIQISP